MSLFSKSFFVSIIFFLCSSNASAFTRIEAESYSSMSGVQFENANTTIGWIDDGDWIAYNNVDFGNGPSSIVLKVAKASTGGSLELRIDGLSGSLIGTFYPENTNSWTNFTEQTCKISGVTGVHTLYLVAKGVSGVCNIDYFQLSDTKIYEPNWVLSWADEFNGTQLDETVWTKFNDGNPHNGELQFYTPRSENIQVSDGTLKLIARRETYTGQGPYMSQPVTRNYTSGKVETLSKKHFRYGKFEASMKLPRAKGSWPAFWMLGENLFESGIGWPRCGEIDIMEHGQDFDNLGAAIHTQAYNHTIGTQKTGTYIINNYDTEFHIYGLEWDANKLIFSVDGNKYFTVTKQNLGTLEAEWPFDQPFWIILNHAVGGAWGGTPDDSKFPITTEIDWVRVYKDIQTSVDEIQSFDSKMSLFPNPAIDKLQIKINSNGEPENKNMRVVVKDLMGKTVINTIQATEQNILNVEHLSSGIYLLSVDNGNYFTNKFIKK